MRKIASIDDYRELCESNLDTLATRRRRLRRSL